MGLPMECPTCRQQSLAWLVSPGGRLGVSGITTRGESMPHYRRLSAGMRNAVAWHGMGPEERPLMVCANKGAVHP